MPANYYYVHNICFRFPHCRLACQGSSVSIICSTVLDNNYNQGFLLGQPLKRSVHILYRVWLICSLSVGSLVLQSEDALQVIVFVFRLLCDCALQCQFKRCAEALTCSSSSSSEVKLSNKTCLLQSIENFSYSQLHQCKVVCCTTSKFYTVNYGASLTKRK